MKITVITSKSGDVLKIEAESFIYLKSVKADYNADQAGMEEAGMCLSSTFRSYVDFDKLNSFEGATEIAKNGLSNAENRFRAFRNFYPSLHD